MRIQNNITAMNTHRQYTINNDNVAKSAEKLSSGYRINRAADDAAGLAISEKMRSQIRGLNMATKNSQDAISLVQTAEGALQETHSMLQRMNELAVQAATGTNQEFDRVQAAKEFEQLKREINDVAEQTTFNNMKILDGSLSYTGYQRSAATAGITVTRPLGAAEPVAETPGGTIANVAIDTADQGQAIAANMKVTVTLTDADGGKIEFVTGASSAAGTDTVDDLLSANNGKLTSTDGKWTATYKDGELTDITNTSDKVTTGTSYTVSVTSDDTTPTFVTTGSVAATSAADAAALASAETISKETTAGTANTAASTNAFGYSAPAANKQLTIDSITIDFVTTASATPTNPEVLVADAATLDDFIAAVNGVLEAEGSDYRVEASGTSDYVVKNPSGAVTDPSGNAAGADSGAGAVSFQAGTPAVSTVSAGDFKAGDKLIVDGETIEVEEGDDVDAIIGKLAGLTNVTAGKDADGNLTITAKAADPQADTTVKKTAGTSSEATSPTTVELDFAKMYEGDKFTVKIGDQDILIEKKDGDTKDTFLKRVEDTLKANTTLNPAGEEPTAVLKGNAIVVSAGTDVGNPDFAENGDVTKVNTKKYHTEAMRIQVGALENEQLGISIDSMNTAGLKLDGHNLNTQDAAGKAITAVRKAVNQVSDQRATLGAMQNRLDHKIANLKVSSENLSAAESRIRDVDMAQEMTNFTKNNILSQAATAMLAQANALPQNVLSLLG